MSLAPSMLSTFSMQRCSQAPAFYPSGRQTPVRRHSTPQTISPSLPSKPGYPMVASSGNVSIIRADAVWKQPESVKASPPNTMNLIIRHHFASPSLMPTIGQLGNYISRGDLIHSPSHGRFSPLPEALLRGKVNNVVNQKGSPNLKVFPAVVWCLGIILLPLMLMPIPRHTYALLDRLLILRQLIHTLVSEFAKTKIFPIPRQFLRIIPSPSLLLIP